MLNCTITSSNFNRVRATADFIEALLRERPGQYCCGRGTISRFLVRLGRNVLYQLRAYVLKPIFELYGLCDCDAIFGDLGASPALF